MSGIETTGYVFGDIDHLALAKLVLVFGLHLVALLVLFRGAAAQKSSFLTKYAMLTASWLNSIMSAAILSLAVCVATVLAGRYSGMTTVLIVNAAVITLYVVEFSVMLSRGFFKRLLDDALQPEIRTFICFIVMVNAGYFTLMFLKDILLSDNLGMR